MTNDTIKRFSPFAFLAPLGAGGLSIAFFAFINYTLEHGRGLISFGQTHAILSGPMEAVYAALELGMALFIIIHIALSLYSGIKLKKWLKTEAYSEMMKSPLQASAVFVPFVSGLMTLNVVIGALRYFVPAMSGNLQSMMLPGLLVWSFIWVALLRMEIRVLKDSFMKGFDLDKIQFGWLMQSFALGMATVTGTGIAALAQSKAVADIAIFMSLITGTMALFLLLVKMVAIFKSQFKREGLPEKQFLPSMLIIVPNITILAISIFRLGHYLEHHQGAHLNSFFMILMTTAFALETWYLLFGISLLRDFIKNNFFKEFHVSQWGMICPFVAYAVLGSFVYNVFLPYSFVFWGIIGVIAFTVFLFFFLLVKQYACARQKSGMTAIRQGALSCN